MEEISRRAKHYAWDVVCPNCHFALQQKSYGPVFSEEDYQRIRRQKKCDFNKVYECPSCNTKFNAETERVVGEVNGSQKTN